MPQMPLVIILEKNGVDVLDASLEKTILRSYRCYVNVRSGKMNVIHGF